MTEWYNLSLIRVEFSRTEKITIMSWKGCADEKINVFIESNIVSLQ